jgi:hypothetical protein
MMTQKRAQTAMTVALGTIVASAGSITAATCGAAKLCLSFFG